MEQDKESEQNKIIGFAEVKTTYAQIAGQLKKMENIQNHIKNKFYESKGIKSR